MQVIMAISGNICLTFDFQPNVKQILPLIAMITCILLTLPWVLHYLHVGVSIVGYPVATNSLASRIAHEGYVPIMMDLFRSLFYQFSYFIIGTWCLIGVCFFLFWSEWKTLSKEEYTVTLFILFCCLGLIALSAFGMSSLNLDYKMPQGRYFIVLLLIIINHV